MAKSKLLIGLLCAALVGPMAACENVNSASNGGPNGGVNNNSTNGGATGTAQEKFDKAAEATKARLLEELEKEVVSLKLDMDFDVEMTYDFVTETYTAVGTQEDWEMEYTSTEVTEADVKMTMAEKGNMVGNFDFKYYTDLLSAETEEDALALTNGTEFYAYTEIEQYGEKMSVEEAVTDNVAYTKIGEDLTKSPIGLETNAQIAMILSELKNVTKLSEEEAINYVMEMLMMAMGGQAQPMPEPGNGNESPSMVADVEEESQEVSTLLIDNVLGFINGTVTSAELVEILLPLISDGEEVDPSMKSFLISVLDYIKTIDLSGLITLTTAQDDNATLFTFTFNYDALKTLIAKLFDDVKALMLQYAPEDSATEIAPGMDAAKDELLAMLPENVEYVETVGVTNNLITSYKTDILVDGNIPDMGSSHVMSLPIDPETGEVMIGGTSTIEKELLKKIDVSFGFNFEFGTEPYEVPTLAAAA